VWHSIGGVAREPLPRLEGVTSAPELLETACHQPCLPLKSQTDTLSEAGSSAETLGQVAIRTPPSHMVGPPAPCKAYLLPRQATSPAQVFGPPSG
jgi:hypothetical protein